MDRNTIAVFGLTGLVIGVILAMQFNTDAPLESGFLTDEIVAKDRLIKDYTDEQDYLKNRIVTLRNQIEEVQVLTDTQAESSNTDTLEKLKKLVGLSEISGAGIEIVLDDGPAGKRASVDVSDEELVQAGDLRDLINVLWAGHAEAVSINGQRIIATSAIVSVGTTILVNNSHMAPPFVINAIGDTEAMRQRIDDNPLLEDLFKRSKKNNVIFQIAVKKMMTIPVYNEDLKANFINLVE